MISGLYIFNEWSRSEGLSKTERQNERSQRFWKHGVKRKRGQQQQAMKKDSVADPDPGSGAFFIPGSRIWDKKLCCSNYLQKKKDNNKNNGIKSCVACFWTDFSWNSRQSLAKAASSISFCFTIRNSSTHIFYYFYFLRGPSEILTAFRILLDSVC